MPRNTVANFGRKHELGSATRQMAADVLFGQSMASRGIDRRDAAIERRIQRRAGRGFVERLRADLSGAKPQR